MKTHIMIHHSLTEDSGTVSWAAIEREHRRRGWEDIGYHAGLERVREDIEEFTYQALLGRPEDMQAAACPQGNMNNQALHLCFVGNFDLAPPAQEALERAAARVIQPWMRRYGIPQQNVVGHRDYNPAKSCPGRMFDLNYLRTLL